MSVDALPCEGCGTMIERRPGKMIALFCEDCRAARAARQKAEADVAEPIRVARAILRAREDFLYDEHGRTGHLSGRIEGCKPCEIVKAIEEAPAGTGKALWKR